MRNRRAILIYDGKLDGTGWARATHRVRLQHVGLEEGGEHVELMAAQAQLVHQPEPAADLVAHPAHRRNNRLKSEPYTYKMF